MVAVYSFSNQIGMISARSRLIRKNEFHSAQTNNLNKLLTAVPIFVFWLYGTLVLAERRSGYIITLLGGLFSLVVPLAHMRGKGVGVTSSLGHSSGHFFFVWVLIAIGVTGLFSVILSARGLWSLPRRRQPR